MVKMYYYLKHHELQAELQKEALEEHGPGIISDLRRSLIQQQFYRAFFDMFIEGYCVTSKELNGDTIDKNQLKLYFDEIWPESEETQNYNNPLMFFRATGANIFLSGAECTTSDWNQETDPWELMIDTREQPSILHDKYEDAVMRMLNIFDKEIETEKFNKYKDE